MAELMASDTAQCIPPSLHASHCSLLLGNQHAGCCQITSRWFAQLIQINSLSRAPPRPFLALPLPCLAAFARPTPSTLHQASA